MFHKVGSNDVALMGSLIYFCVDLWQEWDSFSSCRQPIHIWLFASCVCAITFRACAVLLYFCGSAAESPQLQSEAFRGGLSVGGNIGELLLDLRLKGSWSSMLATTTWVVAVPFFVLWTFLGTAWLWQVLWDTPECFGSTYAWFSIVWLLLCYYWIFVHAALGLWTCHLRRRVIRREANMRDIEDDEVLQRWGRVSQSSATRSLVEVAGSDASLSSAAIKALPCKTVAVSETLLGKCDCPICLTELDTGDRVRCLPGCGHTFHRSCIDLWLVRRADCPLCKRKVGAEY